MCRVFDVQIHHLRYHLQSLQKGSLSISRHLQQIKETYDSLTTTETLVTNHDLIAATLDGLPNEFESFIDSIMLHLSFTSINELLGLLITKELPMSRRKTVASSSVTKPF